MGSEKCYKNSLLLTQTMQTSTSMCAYTVDDLPPWKQRTTVVTTTRPEVLRSQGLHRSIKQELSVRYQQQKFTLVSLQYLKHLCTTAKTSISIQLYLVLFGCRIVKEIHSLASNCSRFYFGNMQKKF